MDSTRRTATIAGWLFIITFVTSIPAVFYFYDPVLNDPNYILGAGVDTRVSFGAFLEILLAISGIGTAVVLYPIVKRQSQSVALGYVATRVVESTVIVVGIISILSIVTLRQDFAGATGADAATLVIAGKSLLALHSWTFLLGPALCAGLGNGLLLGYLMYRSGLVPRGMALIGLIGGPLAFASATAVLLGLYPQTSGISFVFTLPEIVWEASLGIYLVVKGFKPSPITAGMTDAGTTSAHREATV